MGSGVLDLAANRVDEALDFGSAVVPAAGRFPRGIEAEPYFVVDNLRGNVHGELARILGTVVERQSASGLRVLRREGLDKDFVDNGLSTGSLQYFSQKSLLSLLQKEYAGLGITGGGDAPGIADCLSSFAANLRRDRFFLGVGNAGGGLAVSPNDFLNHLIIVDKLLAEDMKGQSSTPFGSARIDLMNGVHGNLMKNVEKFGFLLGTGGNGNMALMEHLAGKFPEKVVVGAFKSIDGDACIDGRPVQMLGFDSAVRTYRRSIYDVVQSAFAHKQVFVVEVFGRGSGRLAFESARTNPAELDHVHSDNNSVKETYRKIKEFGGSVIILVPEKPVSIEDLSAEVQKKRDKYGCCVVVASEQFKLKNFDAGEMRGEKPKIMEVLACVLKNQRGISDVKMAFESYEARGASPSSYDQVMGSRLGEKMAEVVNEGIHGGQAVVYFEGMDPNQDAPAVVPLRGVTDGHTLNNKALYSDELLKNGGVFWKD